MDKLNLDALRPEFEAAMRQQGHRTERLENGDYIGMTSYRWEGFIAARRTAPSSSADELPPLPPLPKADHYDTQMRRAAWSESLVRQAQREAIAADRRKLDEANGDEPEWWHLLHAAAESLEDSGAIANAIDVRYIAGKLLAAIQAAAPADAPTINPMCERKTNHIIERDGYAKSGYVLRKEGADIYVSDGGAVAWFTPEQWNWLMFNRMHTTFDWPKPIGWRAPAEDAREQQPDELPEELFDGHAVYNEITRHLGKSHCHSPDTVSATLDAVVRLIRCRATGTDRAQAGEDA